MITKKIKKERSGKSIFFFIILGISILTAIGFLTLSNWKIYQKRKEFTSRLQVFEEKIQALQKKSQELKAKILQIGSENYLEKEARERLGLKKPGEEVVVVLPPEKNQEEQKEREKNFLEKFLEKIGIFLMRD